MRFEPLPDLRSLVRAKVAAPTRAARRLGHVGAGRPSAGAARRERLYSEAIQLIARRCSESDLTLTNIAEVISARPRTLQKIFAEHGKEFSEVLFSARIAQAAELVLLVPRRVEIGKRVGYGHENHFARAFERRVGVSPSVLRRALCARDRYERIRVEPFPESARSLNAQRLRMRKDAALVDHVRRQLAAAA